MHDRIKALWDTAAKLESDLSWEGQTKFMEKFAELIVNECVEIANENDGTWHGSGVAIKKHFGVEE